MADSGVEMAAAGEVEEEIKTSGEEEPMQVNESDAAADEIVAAAGNHKRKHEDLEPSDDAEDAPAKKQEVSTETLAVADVETRSGNGEVTEDASVEDSDEVKADLVENADQNLEVSEVGEVKTDDQVEQQLAGTDGLVPVETDKEIKESETQTDENGNIPSEKDPESFASPPIDSEVVSHKIEIPNNKVGVLIGKAGETIRYLQFNSGAKIQITRDAEADPNSTTRSVELIGAFESINKAEKLIKDVIAEADAGGSPSLVARGFGTLQSGGEQFEIKVANEKVGLIIGKGGETIKNLQTRSGARIQLIPQHLPEGDPSKERIVRITGDKRQIESAKEMIKDVMNQTPRASHLSSHSQQNYRARGSNLQPHWTARATSPAQRGGHDYQQRGSYPPQSAHYPQPYGGYSQQSAPRGGFGNAGWDQRSSAPAHNAPTSVYDYYGNGGPPSGAQASMANPMSGPSPAPMNYGQSQPPNYGHSAPYGQPAPMQQNYNQSYNDPRYDSQAPNQQFYSQQSMGPQPNAYGQGTTHTGYSQQPPYNKAAYGASQEGPYGVPHQEGPPSYGVPPRASQPGDPTYQGYGPPSYGSGAQQYPYGSNAASQPAPAYNQTYGPASGATDGYAQPPQAVYTQQGGQAPGYGQAGQQASAYSQPTSQPSAYGQYPTPQQGYADPSSGNTNYGYHGGPAQAAYGNNIPASGYASAPAAGSQPGYAQQPSNPSGYYDQTMAPQAGYAANPNTAPGYANPKSVSPQPGYGGQYDSAQYAHH
ncbi:far upstream element-binding protein 3-like [Zingiber officinale]|uniref:far upstream element-binding protein 3-like n=1 Tax=Zingiber officinale TaxID=94328 RepID=UPI001C4B75F1|nr:far upstream element-binding protein 3-like [Zingiber officinale]